MKIGIIYCRDSINTAQDIWFESYKLIFENLGIKPHIIFEPSEAKQGCYYIWRPSAGNFQGKYKNTKNISLKLVELASQFENMGSKIFPSSSNLKFYENKIEILNHVNIHNLKSPETKTFSNVKDALEVYEDFKYPLILKHAYSCNSYGLMKADNIDELVCCLKDKSFNIDNYIFQRRLSINKDIRVNFVKRQNILSYCRYLSKNSISSASRFASRIDHFSVPFQTYEYAYNIGEIFDFPFGGVDFAFDETQDYTSEEPFLLEISPLFDLNPIPNKPIKEWSRFKKSIFWNKRYKSAILQAANLQINYILYNYYLNNHD